MEAGRRKVVGVVALILLAAATLAFMSELEPAAWVEAAKAGYHLAETARFYVRCS